MHQQPVTLASYHQQPGTATTTPADHSHVVNLA